jgi:hypothetical protein
MNALPKQQAFAEGAALERSLRPAMRLVAETSESVPKVPKFPQRPNLQVLSESIPLFYICQNRHGFWVARDVEGRAGGLFLRKQSALHFAQRRSATGCAIMQLSEPIELDVENQGNRIAAPLGAILDLATRRVPLLANFAGMVIMEWRKLVAQISNVLVSGRKHRDAAERELFRNQHWLSLKSDDDLPVS